MCGRCKKNYSLSIGTTRCLPYCPAYMVYILVGVWIISGILFILFLILCNFTISEGTINGLFFYVHMIHKNANLFFPGSTGTSNTNLFRLFIAWLNLDLGIEVCFYKTMTQYEKVWLHFGYLLYIWMLECFIILLSRKYIFFTRLIGRNWLKSYHWCQTLTMVLFAGILCYHCTKQLKSYHWCQKLKVSIITNGRVKLLKFKIFDVRHDEEETEPFLRQDEYTPQVTHFNNYREVLIED